MTDAKELPNDLGKLIIVQKYSGKHLEKPVAAVNTRVDIFGSMWLEVNSENPQLFMGYRIEEWVSAYASADDATTDCDSGDETRAAYLIDRFSDDDAFYCLRPPLMGIEYVLVSRSAGKRYVLASDSMSYVTNDRSPLLNGEFESDKDALKALGYQAGPTK